eukprot:jgi/Hompol1/3412/HPOL_003230-RA
MGIVHESAEFVAANSASVSINNERLETAADTILERMSEVSYSTANWKQHTLHPKTQDASTIDWIFLIDLLNFSFWNERSVLPRFSITFDDETYKGYWTLCACIQRALRQGIPITTPSFWIEASTDELKQVFQQDKGTDEMPMLETRIEMLKRAGRILVDNFGGHFVNCILGANQSAQQLMQIVVEHFGDLFEDAVEYKGRRVVLSKRLQILVADIWACFDGQSLGTFTDISTVTMFADYRVPQALVYFGILQYSPDLYALLKQHEAYHEQVAVSSQDTVDNATNMIPRGHPYEVEIRGCSIWAVELLVSLIRRKMRDQPTRFKIREDQVNPIIVDFYLWDEAYKNQAAMAHIPIHRTRSIYY